jgi:N-acetyl-gamma-glutamyl-phosphate reductase
MACPNPPRAHRGAKLVGNPGCYPTSVILALAPLVKNGLVQPGTLIADCKSGVSGAGRGLSDTVHYCEANESMKAYKWPRTAMRRKSRTN